ncbi:MAG: isoprenyl transferase [Clostridia bacterium]|nr:isoprenyl transferase [Clostridia bacterium]
MMGEDTKNIPQHIAIIMDGNRRWARERNLNVSEGHKRGAEILEKIAYYCNKIQIKYLTVYAFSTENWKRSKEEVGALMNLLRFYLDKFSKRADTENIKIKVLGDIEVLEEGLKKSIKKAIEKTKANTGLTLNIALNYGGRAELTTAMKKIATKVKQGLLNPDDITESTIESNLYTAGNPDPDLLIRTSGELRTSNFLPWQIVYSEFIFKDKFWPEFNEDDINQAINIYQKRNRKFGGK